MSKYLTTVMKILPVVQARQISDLLQDLRAKGELRDVQDYQRALADLVKLVNAENPKPMFEHLRAVIWGLVRSDAHNTMMQAAKNDIEAVFLQTDEIGRRLDDHHFYLMQGLITDLERALQDQEDRIKELKMKATKNNEFIDVIYNSFARTSLKMIDRSDPNSNLLFFDNRTERPVKEEDIPSAYISEHGAKILLAPRNEPRILPVSAKLLFDEESHGTTLMSTVNNNISNIIDGTKDTFWSRTVYADDTVDRMSTIIEFDLGTGRDINYCVIEGATTEPFFVAEMSGIGLDGSVTDLLLRRSACSNDLVDNDYLPEEENEVLIDGWERIDFPQTFAKAIRIKFVYGSFKEADYFVSDKTDIGSIYEAEHPADMSATDIAPIAREVVLSSEMAEICNVPSEEYSHVNSNVYTFSLDNVWFGNSLYHDSSIFVSQPIHLDAPGVIAIKSKEKGIGVYINEDSQYDGSELSDDSFKNACSVEYELIRDSIDKEGMSKRDHFPIPYLGQTVVLRERLVLIKKVDSELYNDTGVLRFCPRTVYETGGIEVFRNGQLVSPNTGWQWATSENTDDGSLEWHLADFTNPQWWNFRLWNLNPQKFWIKIIQGNYNDVYTISYTIRTSQLIEEDLLPPYNPSLSPLEGRVFVDKGRMVYMGEEGRLHFLPDPETGITREADIYTQITLRRNTPQYSMSPEVVEFAFLSAPYKVEVV